LNKPAMFETRYIGRMPPAFRLFLWPDRLLLLGPAYDTDFHRHHAAQLCLGLEGAVRLRLQPGEEWRLAPGFFVAPDQAHQFDAAGGATAMLYLDGESAACRAWRSRLPASSGALPDTAAVAPLRRLLDGDEAPETLAAALCGLGVDGRAPAAALEPRVGAALDWIAAHIDQPVRLDEVAAAACLSGSHLAHLFSAQVGIPLRRYVLWRRLRTAVELALRGDSLTAAAHAAGFADSAHLSRTFRDNFGVTPSFLFERRTAVDIRILPAPG
jgi:AraC family transcriptional regulator